MTTCRQTLSSQVAAVVGAATAEQLAKIEGHLEDIFLGIQLGYREEILCDDMNATDLLRIKNECIRRYRSG